ncbi:reverse transcriptase domain-containing protein, partial [Tanacetum coccineum]
GRLLGQFSALQSFSSDGVPHLTARSLISDVAQHDALSFAARRKGDPDDFIHAFEGATKMEKWVMPVSCHMFVYILKDAARIWWNSLPKGVVLNYEDLKRRFRTYFNQQKKQTKTHFVVNGIKRKEGESVRAFTTRYTDETAQISKLNEKQRIAGFVHGVKIYPQNSQKATMDSWTKYTPGYKQKKWLPKADLSSSWTTTQEKSPKKEGHGKGQEGRTEKDETIAVPTKKLPPESYRASPKLLEKSWPPKK